VVGETVIGDPLWSKKRSEQRGIGWNKLSNTHHQSAAQALQFLLFNIRLLALSISHGSLHRHPTVHLSLRNHSSPTLFDGVHQVPAPPPPPFTSLAPAQIPNLPQTTHDRTRNNVYNPISPHCFCPAACARLPNSAISSEVVAAWEGRDQDTSGGGGGGGNGGW
jgi:hypothetical protein